jgi:chromosome segregation ATPase
MPRLPSKRKRVVRQKAQGELRNLQADLEQAREQLEEEQSGRADLQRLLQKANAEASTLKQKLESGEGGVRSEELEELKRKLGAKLLDTESQLEAALTKAASLEKNNNRLKGELEDLSIQVRINHMAHWADARGPAGGRGPAAAGPAMLHACIVIGLTICMR